jgi:transcriptional regulator with XRE-family HTH domain
LIFAKITIKDARKIAGLTQTQMAARYQIPLRTIEDWESGKRKPASYVEKLLIKDLTSSTVFDGVDIDVNDIDNGYSIKFCVETEKEGDVGYFDSAEEALYSYQSGIYEFDYDSWLELCIIDNEGTLVETIYLAQYIKNKTK